MSRYQSLNVSLQTDNRNISKLTSTLEYQPNDVSQNQQGDAEERVKRFRELYYKNQKLRRQLKLLNTKLNEKLEKVKLPNVRKKALSVDLNQSPPITKAQQRQLQNGYKQIKMYKQQIEVLKVKQQTPESYQRLRNMENAITYKDLEINEVQAQLKSIKNIMKMQQKKIVSDLENQDVKERITQYQIQLKSIKDKLKELARKDRKRQQDYKKQQAYLVSIQKKLRGIDADQGQKIPIEEKNNIKQITDHDWDTLNKQIQNQKNQNQEILKKIENLKRNLKITKAQNYSGTQTIKQKQIFIKTLYIKIQSLKRLSKQAQKVQVSKKINNFSVSKISQFSQQSQGIELSNPTVNVQKLQKFQTPPPKLKDSTKNQRQWTKKTRKIQHGFMDPNDIRFQMLGKLKGIKIFLDQNEIISGIVPIMQESSKIKTQQIYGNRTNKQLKWQVLDNDEITKVLGSFNPQGYLNQFCLVSKNGINAKFGKSSIDQFVFKLDKSQAIDGIYGAIRKLGSDTRITQIGLWISKVIQSEKQVSSQSPFKTIQ